MSAASRSAGRQERGSATHGRSATSHAFLPWAPPLVAIYALIVVLGLALWIIGYAIVANEVVYADQEPGITLAALGVAVSAAAGALFLGAGRRAVTARRVRVLGLVPRQSAEAVAHVTSVSPVLVGGEGLARYHRSDCPLAAGRNWPVLDAAQHASEGRKPCGVCRP